MGNFVNAHIYCVTNMLNGKRYVGQTVKSGKVGHGTALALAYKKYGLENFSYEKICTGIETREQLDTLEKYWIRTMGTVSPHGYNIEQGGRDKGEVSESTREKLRKANIGKTISLETRAKISAAMKGEKNPFYRRTHTDAARAKCRLGRLGKPSPYKGVPRPLHVLEALLRANIGRKQSAHTRELRRAKMIGKKQEIVTCPHCDTSGCKPVMTRYHFSRCTGIKPFRARLMVDGKRVHLGYFMTQEAADLVVQETRSLIHG